MIGKTPPKVIAAGGLLSPLTGKVTKKDSAIRMAPSHVERLSKQKAFQTRGFEKNKKPRIRATAYPISLCYFSICLKMSAKVGDPDDC